MGEYKVIPKNEMQTREWFMAHLNDYDDVEVLSSNTAFPDCVLRYHGKVQNVEMEYESGNFVIHGHDVKQCDLVICWNHTANLPIPILELSTGIEHKPNDGAKIPQCSYYPKTAKGIKAKDISWAKLCQDELHEFTDALVKDIHAYNEYIMNAIPIRHKLNTTQKRLEDAIRENGGREFLDRLGRLHPYDLNKALADVLFTAKVVLGEGDDGQ